VLALLAPLLDGRRGRLGRSNEHLLALGTARLVGGRMALLALALGGRLLLGRLEEVLSGLELEVELGRLRGGREGRVDLLLLCGRGRVGLGGRSGSRSGGGGGSGGRARALAERSGVGVAGCGALCGVLARRLLGGREVLFLEL